MSQDKALMPPPSDMQNLNSTRMQSHRFSDVTDAQMVHTEHLIQQPYMTRAYSIDSGLSEQNPVHIDGYDTVMYEIESEAEAQEFLLGTESDTGGSSARARGVTGRKTKTKKTTTGRAKATSKISATAPKGRRGIRKESDEIDVENDC